MNPTRDEILRMLMVMMLRHPDSQSSIQALNLLEYPEPFTISDDGSDDLKIPYVGYVKRLINESSSGADLTYRVFLIPSADITEGSINLTGRENQQGDTIIPSDANVSIYEGGKTVPATYYENGLIEGLDGSLDVKVVLIGGEPQPPVFNIASLDNFSSDSFQYNINGGANINLDPLSQSSEFLNIGDIINVVLFSGQTVYYNVFDANSNLIYTSDQAGPFNFSTNPVQEGYRQSITVSNT